MSPSSSPRVARRRLRRPQCRSRGRRRTPKPVAISTKLIRAIRSRKLNLRYAVVVIAVWLVATGAYFASLDDNLTRLIDGQIKLKATYEDRIADLRAQVDRIVTQKRLDQDQVEQRINALLQRQARISLSLDKVGQQQVAALADVEERMARRERRIQGVLADLGVRVGRGSTDQAIGGPFIPVKLSDSGANEFETQLYRLNAGRAQMDLYRRALDEVPIRKPVIGETDMTSPFGVRMHPLLGRVAMHTGIDLRGDIGDPVRATATGKVTIADRQGGYGKMVEISHCNGLATRFGHLSEISVKVGQVVRIGEMVGRIGSTGLSTGPHLHYETRVNGEAVDPQIFLRAGSSLAGDLSR